MPQQFETVEMPFTQFGNRRGFTFAQYEDDPAVRSFVRRFRQRFEYDSQRDVVLFIETVKCAGDE